MNLHSVVFSFFAQAVSVLATADIAEVMAAPAAHVVATFDALDVGLAFIASLVFLVQGKLFQLLVFFEVRVVDTVFGAGLAGVLVALALNAVLLATFGTIQLRVLIVKFKHIGTIRGRAPVQIGAGIHSHRKSP